MSKYNILIASKLSISKEQVAATIALFEEGGTVPFIARYRKEATGSLDEVKIAQVKDLLEEYKEIDERRAYILKSIEEQEKLTEELKLKIMEAITLTQLEDIYLPYKPKRKTKATIAKEKGLEPLAQLIFDQEINAPDNEAAKYINVELGVATKEEALIGAKDIIAEWISENEIAREKMRKLFKDKATIKSTVRYGKKEEGIKYEDYFEWEEPLMACPSHRMLAMRRGENENILGLDFAPASEDAIDLLNSIFLKGRNQCATLVKEAAEDSYKRLLQPSMESEFRMLTKKSSDEEAIKVFAENIKELLLSSPLGRKRILAIDPGFRTGCKVVVLDEQGKLIEDSVIYPHTQGDVRASELEIFRLAAKYNVEAIAIGNGTAGRETETFVKNIKSLDKEVVVVMVNESGASIYSASEVAREEFPDKDITVRGAVSIGRRLADPLAELVKIDPKSIGVGQYQHDVDQGLLKKKLDDVVGSCVNNVGVELNTASKELLTYVSGLGPALATNIIKYRNENGAFKNRKDLLKVARMGDKAFEQSAGFLRINDAENPLDKSAVHPESYYVVEKMSKDLGCQVVDLVSDAELRKKINAAKYVDEKVGLLTIQDILKELEKPGRDPRREFEIFEFDANVNSIKDLHTDMILPGIVTNVTNFGAFVDIGVHQDGLIHISQLSDTFVDDPNKVVKVGQKVTVTVTEVDAARKRIALSMKGINQKSGKAPTASTSSTPSRGNSSAIKTKASTSSKPEPQDMASMLSALKDKFK